jgi:hypothetical protein
MCIKNILYYLHYSCFTILDSMFDIISFLWQVLFTNIVFEQYGLLSKIQFSFRYRADTKLLTDRQIDKHSFRVYTMVSSLNTKSPISNHFPTHKHFSLTNSM